MTLEVLICTFNERMGNVPDVLLPPMAGVSYLISFQSTEKEYLNLVHLPAFDREDVRIVSMSGRGLAANRNNALLHAQGDVLLIADDDVRYEADYFQSILQSFSNNKVDVACFQAETYDGKPFKNYPKESFTYSQQPRGYYFSSIEIAFRREASVPTFDERFGLGSDFLAGGEEEVFLWECHQAGLQITYFPEVIVKTSAETTGKRQFLDSAVQRSKGAVLQVMHGNMGAFLRCLKFSFTHFRQGNPFSMMNQMCRGICYVSRSNKKVSSQPLVSLVIPYYNRAKYFQRTLDSVSVQRYPHLEILLVDNGSTDESVDMARQFKESHESESCQIYLLKEIKRGAAAARNEGLKAAKGKYVYFFDSDDEFSPDFISQAVAKAEAESLDLVAAVTEMQHPDGNIESRFYGYSKAPSLQILTGMLSTQAMFFRTAFLKKIEGWNELLPYWNDWELGVRVLFDSPKMVWLKGQRFHKIHLHPESITGTNFSDSVDKIIVAVNEVKKAISSAPSSFQKSARRALYFRLSIIAGKIAEEGSKTKADTLIRMRNEETMSFLVRSFSDFLFFYTRHGGKGAWRLAKRLV